MGKWDELIARLGTVSGGAPRTHAGIRFDNAEGLGGVHDAANADYRGFTAYMRPSQFLQANPPRDLEVRPIDHILEALDAGSPLGSPIVYVERRPDRSWQVVGHEGRGRMTALGQRHPDSLFPVAVHPLGWERARHLTPEDALNWMRQDSRGELPTRPVMSILKGGAVVQPSDAEFLEQYGAHPALQSLLEELAQ